MSAKTRMFGRTRHDLEERTSYLFSLIAFKQTRCLAEMYTRKFAISVGGWKMLAVIGRFSPLSASVLAEKTATTGDKVTRVVDQLVASGLVRRRTDRDDRRRIVLTLSAKGKRVYGAIEATLRVIEDEFLAILSPAEREHLYTALAKLETHAAALFDRKDAWRHIVKGRTAPANTVRQRPLPLRRLTARP
jgi:DNA-binding MarR family transcriptional regulator